MTHIVSESCIKCKYTDCVDVCPVDCFRVTLLLVAEKNNLNFKFMMLKARTPLLLHSFFLCTLTFLRLCVESIKMVATP